MGNGWQTICMIHALSLLIWFCHAWSSAHLLLASHGSCAGTDAPLRGSDGGWGLLYTVTGWAKCSATAVQCLPVLNHEQKRCISYCLLDVSSLDLTTEFSWNWATWMDVAPHSEILPCYWRAFYATLVSIKRKTCCCLWLKMKRMGERRQGILRNAFSLLSLQRSSDFWSSIW